MLKTEIGQEGEDTLGRALPPVCDPEGHRARGAAMQDPTRHCFQQTRGRGALLFLQQTPNTARFQTGACEAPCSWLESGVGLCRRAQCPGGATLQLRNQVGCLGGRTNPCALSRARAGAGRRLPPRTALLPCQLLGHLGIPRRRPSCTHKTWVSAFGQFWGTAATRRV